jgi:hypothetical protein
MKYDILNNKEKNIKKYTLLQNNQKKPKKFILINSDTINIILTSDNYNSSFDDPFKTGINPDDLNYRISEEQKEKWIDYIINGDPKIIKIKKKKNYVVLKLQNYFSKQSNNNYRYITFFGFKKGEKNAFKDFEVTKKEEKLHNVSDKSKSKRKRKSKNK